MTTEPTFDELMREAIRAVDVTCNTPRHLSRKDLRKWRRRAWVEEFDTQLAIGGIVAASLCFFLIVLGVVVSL